MAAVVRDLVAGADPFLAGEDLRELARARELLHHGIVEPDEFEVYRDQVRARGPHFGTDAADLRDAVARWWPLLSRGGLEPEEFRAFRRGKAGRGGTGGAPAGAARVEAGLARLEHLHSVKAASGALTDREYGAVKRVCLAGVDARAGKGGEHAAANDLLDDLLDIEDLAVGAALDDATAARLRLELAAADPDAALRARPAPRGPGTARDRGAAQAPRAPSRASRSSTPTSTTAARAAASPRPAPRRARAARRGRARRFAAARRALLARAGGDAAADAALEVPWRAPGAADAGSDEGEFRSSESESSASESDSESDEDSDEEAAQKRRFAQNRMRLANLVLSMSSAELQAADDLRRGARAAPRVARAGGPAGRAGATRSTWRRSARASACGCTSAAPGRRATTTGASTRTRSTRGPAPGGRARAAVGRSRRAARRENVPPPQVLSGRINPLTNAPYEDDGGDVLELPDHLKEPARPPKLRPGAAAHPELPPDGEVTAVVPAGVALGGLRAVVVDAAARASCLADLPVDAAPGAAVRASAEGGWAAYADGDWAALAAGADATHLGGGLGRGVFAAKADGRADAAKLLGAGPGAAAAEATPAPRPGREKRRGLAFPAAVAAARPFAGAPAGDAAEAETEAAFAAFGAADSDAVESWLYPAFPDLTRLAIAADDDVPRVSRRGSLEEPMDTAE